MKKLSKDYLLMTMATIISVIISLVIFNAEVFLNNSLIWQLAIFAGSSLVLFSLVKMYLLSQKMSEYYKIKKNHS